MVTAVVVNVYKEKPDVFAGRSSSAPKVRARHGDMPGLDGAFGNDHAVGFPCLACSGPGISVVHTTEEAIRLFERDFFQAVRDPEVREAVLALTKYATGDVLKLGCFCKQGLSTRPVLKDKPCHVDVIADWLNMIGSLLESVVVAPQS